MYYIVIHSSVDEHLSCLNALAVVNGAAVKIRVHVSYWTRVFSGYIHSSGIAGSYSSSIFIFFLRNFHTVLHSDVGSLLSHQYCRAVFTHHTLSSIYWLYLFGRMFILTSMRWYIKWNQNYIFTFNQIASLISILLWTPILFKT